MDMSIEVLKGEKMFKGFMRKNFKRQIKQIGIKKVIKQKVDKFYVKCKVYGNPFNSWIDKKILPEAYIHSKKKSWSKFV